jgi:5-hydroxyisourate hydrolase-like protein (transthyretin family)
MQSAAAVTYGHENTETLTVHVRPQYSGTPAGKITIKASRPNHQPLIVCTINLRSGTGKCVLQARTLRPGKYALVATYGGSIDFNASASPKEALTIRK